MAPVSRVSATKEEERVSPTNPSYKSPYPARLGFPKPRKTYHRAASTRNRRWYSYWPEGDVLIGIAYPILKNTLLQPALRSVFRLLRLPLLCSVEHATATTCQKNRGAGGQVNILTRQV